MLYRIQNHVVLKRRFTYPKSNHETCPIHELNIGDLTSLILTSQSARAAECGH